MNAKQAAKKAAKKIEELEHYNARCKADITLYNQVITGMIAGECACKWCEDHEECQLTDKDVKGCENWWLAYTQPSVEEDADESEGVPLVGSTGRA